MDNLRHQYQFFRLDVRFLALTPYQILVQTLYKINYSKNKGSALLLTPRFNWCPGPESNRYEAKLRGILSPLRLPIPPPRQTLSSMVKCVNRALRICEAAINGYPSKCQGNRSADFLSRRRKSTTPWQRQAVATIRGRSSFSTAVSSAVNRSAG